MKPRGRMGAALAAVALTVAALGACSGSDEPESASPTSSGSPTAGPAPSGRSVRLFCQITETFNQRLTTAALRVGDDDPAQVRQFVDELRTASQEVAAAAPTDISADTRIITDAVATFVGSLEQENYDPALIADDAAAALTGPEVQTASQNLETYISSRCPTDR